MTPSLTTGNNKCWLIHFCLETASKSALASPPPHIFSSHLPLTLACMDVLLIVCKKYFDLVRRDLFFDATVQLILANIDLKWTACHETPLVENLKLKNLKLFEEFARCLATAELRVLSGVDLNDASKFWSHALSSKLSTETLCDESRYMLAASACDCLASMGAACFELLPVHKRVYCLTSLLHLTQSPSNIIRSASARALGVYVTFTSLKVKILLWLERNLCFPSRNCHFH